MNGDITKARHLLKDGYTFVAVRNDEIKTSKERGVRPLLSLLDEGIMLSGFSAADKVIGKGAAHLYVLLEADEIYAEVISTPAYDLLNKNGINVGYSSIVDGIKNRKNTGMCPIETATLDIDDSKYALEVIRNTLKNL